MSKKENAKNLFDKRRISQIEIDEEEEKIDTSSKNDKIRNNNDSSISEYQMRKRMMKTKLSDNDQIARINRRSTLSNQEYEQWWYDSWFTDEFSEESSELSSEPEENIRNLTSLTEIFQIIPSQMDGNWLFHTLNNLVFGGQNSAEDIRNEICAFLIRKRHLYENLWEGDFDTHIRNMKRNGF